MEDEGGPLDVTPDVSSMTIKAREDIPVQDSDHDQEPLDMTSAISEEAPTSSIESEIDKRDSLESAGSERGHSQNLTGEGASILDDSDDPLEAWNTSFPGRAPPVFEGPLRDRLRQIRSIPKAREASRASPRSSRSCSISTPPLDQPMVQVRFSADRLKELQNENWGLKQKLWSLSHLQYATDDSAMQNLRWNSATSRIKELEGALDLKSEELRQVCEGVEQLQLELYAESNNNGDIARPSKAPLQESPVATPVQWREQLAAWESKELLWLEKEAEWEKSERAWKELQFVWNTKDAAQKDMEAELKALRAREVSVASLENQLQAKEMNLAKREAQLTINSRESKLQSASSGNLVREAESFLPEQYKQMVHGDEALVSLAKLVSQLSISKQRTEDDLREWAHDAEQRERHFEDRVRDLQSKLSDQEALLHSRGLQEELERQQAAATAASRQIYELIKNFFTILTQRLGLEFRARVDEELAGIIEKSQSKGVSKVPLLIDIVLKYTAELVAEVQRARLVPEYEVRVKQLEAWLETRLDQAGANRVLRAQLADVQERLHLEREKRRAENDHARQTFERLSSA